MSYQNLPYTKLKHSTYAKCHIKHVNEPEYKLRKRYNKLKLVLMVQDPYCIFAYWELPLQIFNNSIEHGEKRKLILRVINIIKNTVKDIELPDKCDNYYISVENTNNIYEVELVALDVINASEKVLAKSNCVRNQKDYSYLKEYKGINDINNNQKQDIKINNNKRMKIKQQIMDKTNSNYSDSIKFANIKDIIGNSKDVRIKELKFNTLKENKWIINNLRGLNDKSLYCFNRGELNDKGVFNDSSTSSSSICKASRI